MGTTMKPSVEQRTVLEEKPLLVSVTLTDENDQPIALSDLAKLEVEIFDIGSETVIRPLASILNVNGGTFGDMDGSLRFLCKSEDNRLVGTVKPGGIEPHRWNFHYEYNSSDAADPVRPAPETLEILVRSLARYPASP